ncbi:MAG: branched-chain amino acid ABC transporter permease [Rhodospirillaceae bacterium]|nr:branched-chain amino acid ABC transporter permease [Rhodospirillaceae bacterium]MBT4590259.1 branched-chain amino acid ABC transporter permease [Rhodospirillaceae bacterium]MBT5941123.1 branched-chain amino acid ABC transporter permease [Rhodospirillaceae bacterium]
MDFWTLANALATGLLTGLVYGLSALGLSVIFGVIRIVNFAHGEIMVMGMFFALIMFRWLGLDPLLSIPLAAAILFVFGYFLQSTVISRVAHLPDHMQFLLLAALAVMIVNACLLIFGPDPQAINISYSFDSFDIGENLIIDKSRAYAAIAAVAISGLLLGFFKYSRTGKAIRACADNYLGAQVVGLKVSHLYALTFGIGAAVLGAAGCVLLLLIEVHPYLAPGYTLLAFVIVIIGGLGSMTGALVGGILIGMSEALAAIIFQPSMKSAFSFGLLILVLLLRPQGLMGKSVK